MRIYNQYLEDKRLDRTWYDSSNVIYSECLDKEDDYKELTVVFSNGTRYVYHKVNVMDYMVFREDMSQGKALNRLIKKNGYKYDKLENVDTNAIMEEGKSLMEKSKILNENKEATNE